MSQYILTIDAGTTSERAILFDHDAQIKEIVQKDINQIYPRPGWVEHDPNEIWSTQLHTLEELMLNQKLEAKTIAAIGITNQRETTIVWDRNTGEPVYNAIVWQDRRTADYCESLKEKGLLEKIQDKTGLLLDAYFSASKIRWILDHVDGAQEKAERGDLAFGTVDSWIIWQLTQGEVHVTDVSNSSRTMLFNIHSLEWDEELLSIFNIPKEMLPAVKSSSEIVGYTNLLGGQIPIAGVVGDQQAALFGHMCVSPGMCKNTYGTGCFTMLNTGEKIVKSKNMLLSTIAWKIGSKVTYALEGSIFIGGAIVQWLRDNLKIIDTAPEIETLALSVDSSEGVVFVPGFVGLGAPHWDQYSTGILIGLTRGTENGHIARAALEAIALQSMEVLQTMAEDSGIEISHLHVDGGASSNNLLMQLQADIAQLPIVRPVVNETTAMGAAFLAGLAVKFWSDQLELKQYWKEDTSFHPSDKNYDQVKANWFKGVERSKGWNKK